MAALHRCYLPQERKTMSSGLVIVNFAVILATSFALNLIEGLGSCAPEVSCLDWPVDW
jgi:hypothetical protein